MFFWADLSRLAADLATGGYNPLVWTFFLMFLLIFLPFMAFVCQKSTSCKGFVFASKLTFDELLLAVTTCHLAVD